MFLIFNTILKFLQCIFNIFSNFCNKIFKNFLNFSKIILFKYYRIKFYFYLAQFLKYFSFILYEYTLKYFYNWLAPLTSAWPPSLNISSGYGPAHET